MYPLSGEVVWQHRVETQGVDRRGKPRTYATTLWIPPQAERVQALVIGSMGLHEDIGIRESCARAGVAIARTSGFGFDKAGDTSHEKVLAALAEVSGHSELKTCPWISTGHSAGGIFARNVAYAMPDRVAGVIFHKSGNLRAPDWAPDAHIRGIPFLAISGQFEEFGPNGDVPADVSNESQWWTVRDTFTNLATQSREHLFSLAVDPGAGHFSWEPHHGKLAGLFIEKAVKCQGIKAESGWLSDHNVTDPKHPAAPFADYAGDKSTAMWHFDEEMYRAYESFCTGTKGKRDQMVTFLRDGNPVRTREDGDNPRIMLPFELVDDGLSFKVAGAFRERYPKRHIGAGKPLGHAPGPVRLKVIKGDVLQTGPDLFQFTGPGVQKSCSIMVYHPGNNDYRYCEQPGEMRRFRLPNANGKPQTITFEDVPIIKVGGRDSVEPLKLKASSSAGLPVSFQVDYGPAVIEGDGLRVAEVPVKAKFPIEIRVTAYNLGRGLPKDDMIAPAQVSQKVEIIK